MHSHFQHLRQLSDLSAFVAMNSPSETSYVAASSAATPVYGSQYGTDQWNTSTGMQRFIHDVAQHYAIRNKELENDKSNLMKDYAELVKENESLKEQLAWYKARSVGQNTRCTTPSSPGPDFEIFEDGGRDTSALPDTNDKGKENENDTSSCYEDAASSFHTPPLVAASGPISPLPHSPPAAPSHSEPEPHSTGDPLSPPWSATAQELKACLDWARNSPPYIPASPPYGAASPPNHGQDYGFGTMTSDPSTGIAAVCIMEPKREPLAERKILEPHGPHRQRTSRSQSPSPLAGPTSTGTKRSIEDVDGIEEESNSKRVQRVVYDPTIRTEEQLRDIFDDEAKGRSHFDTPTPPRHRRVTTSPIRAVAPPASLEATLIDLTGDGDSPVAAAPYMSRWGGMVRRSTGGRRLRANRA